MLIILSPAKTLDYVSPVTINDHTMPRFITDSAQLISICQRFSTADIASLMKVSDPIAALNATRFASWSTSFTTDNSRQALLAFKGDVYTGFNAVTMNEQDAQWAQSHLRILSGLYGLLRPLDLMQPYRLEMGTKLENARGANLYQFWGDKVTDTLQQDLRAQGDDVLINLASNEYFKAVKVGKLTAKIITPVFKDWKNGEYKVISFFAKKARGMMARYLIDERINSVDGINAFCGGGYAFSAEESTDSSLVFKRKQ